MITPDTLKSPIRFTPRADISAKPQLTYFYSGNKHLVLKGKLKNNAVFIVMQRAEEHDFLLVSRGFQCINETL